MLMSITKTDNAYNYLKKKYYSRDNPIITVHESQVHVDL